MGNETSSVHHIEDQPSSRQPFKPLFASDPSQTYRTVSPQQSKRSLIQQQILLDIPPQKKNLREINKHVESLLSYEKQKQEKIRFQQKEKEYQEEQQCTFQPDTGRQDASVTRRTFREFLADQQTFQKKRDGSVQKQAKIKQEYLKSQEPVRRQPKSPPNDQAFQRLYGKRKLPPKPKSKGKSPNTSRVKTKGQQLYQTFKAKQASKVVEQPVKKNFQVSEGSQELLYARGVREFMQDINQTAKDKHRISYIEFCEMFRKIGFTKSSTISETMIKERSLVYDAWGMLTTNGSVDYRCLMSFCFAVLGFDLAKYWQDPSQKTVIKGYSSNSNYEGSESIQNNQTIDHFFPNQKSKLIVNHSFNPNNSSGGWSSLQPSLKLGETKMGVKFFSTEQIAQIRQHFSTFSVNRLNAQKQQPVQPTPPKKSPRSAAEQEMFKTRRARILEQAVKQGMILSAQGVSHADYLIIAKRLQQLKISRQRQQKQRESLAQATFQPVTSDYQFKNEQHRDRMRYTAQQRCQALYQQSQNTCKTFHTAPPQQPSYSFTPDISKNKVDTKPVYAKNVDKFVNRIRNTNQQKEQVSQYFKDRGAAKVPTTLSPDKAEYDEEVVLYVDVNVDSSRIQRIALRPGDNPRNAAMGFVQKHGLDPRFLDQLTEMLRLHLTRLQ